MTSVPEYAKKTQMQFKIIKLSYLYFVCIMKQRQKLYILNIFVTLDILQLSKIENAILILI